MRDELPARVAEFVASLDPEEVEDIASVAIGEGGAPFVAEYRKLAFHDDAASATRTLIRFRQHMHSRVCLDLNHGVLAKTVRRFAEYGILAREVRWLEVLEGSGRAPTLVDRCGDTLRMRYVGEPVRRYNLPPDWEAQAQELLSVLRQAGCCHNDIKCDNLTVLDGRLHLIDFGFATRVGEPIPGEWPPGIGRQHRLGIHRFDDRVAIFAALASAARGEIDRSVVIAG